MRNKVWPKAILVLVSLLFAIGLVNIVGASDSDMAITSNVQKKLQNDIQLMGSRIDVEAKDGEVTLTGTVSSDEDITRATELARSINGVKMVDNRLKKVIGPSHYCPDGPSIAWSC